jgi:hypothetical protein
MQNMFKITAYTDCYTGTLPIHTFACPLHALRLAEVAAYILSGSGIQHSGVFVLGYLLLFL